MIGLSFRHAGPDRLTVDSLLIVAAAVLMFALLSRPLAQSVLTGPLAFLALGIALNLFGGVEIAEANHLLHVLAEITLVMVLFSDAATIDFHKVRVRHQWPERMLFLGIPLAIVMGFGIAYMLLPGWPVFEVALLAAILTPTDAALGQAVVTNLAVPERIRQTLAIESGLNDGLALPAILFFASLATGDEHAGSQTYWLLFAAKQVGFGVLVGVGTGALGALALAHASARKLSGDAFEGIAVVALVVLGYCLAERIGGNTFIAAFTGGFAFGAVMRGRCAFVFEFMDGDGQLLVLGTFLLLGASLAPEAIMSLDLPTLALIALSLFVVRPLAIWLSLIGTDATPVERLFMGWFGPRGLATALFALFIIKEYNILVRAEDLLDIAILTVLASALMHGLTAAPAAHWMARRTGARPAPPVQREAHEPGPRA